MFWLANRSNSVSVGNFAIGTASASLPGDILGGATDVTFFDLQAKRGDRVILKISTELAGALDGIFDGIGLESVKFGIGTTEPEISAVPLPTGGLLLLGGMAALGVLRCRKQPE